MKKTTVYLSLILFVFSLFFVGVSPVKAETKTVIYFKGTTCLGCKELENDGFYDKVDALGFDIIIYDVEDNDMSLYDLSMYDFEGEPNIIDLWTAFGRVYGAPKNMTTPSVFVGDSYYMGAPDIIKALDDGSFEAAGQKDLLDVNVLDDETFSKITGFLGFLTVLGAGLLDGFNPCAIALLLLFVSLLSSNDNKKSLLLISITYISALFVSYLLIGTSLFFVLKKYSEQAHLLNNIISIIIIVVVLVLFAYNMYDYIVTKKEDYGSVKNQLPKWIQKFNKKIMTRFTDVINNPDKKSNIFKIVGLTFVLGIIMSFTEFLCTGQIYGAIIIGIYEMDSAYAYIALVAYNIMFVSPLIVIAVLSIRGNGAIVISNWVREHLHTIKLLNALLFLFIGIFFILRLLGVV